jgi:hypothetical protein
MRVNRRFLYWGIFLVATGGILTAVDLGGLDSGSIADGLRLWPLALVVIGIAIVVRRTAIGLPSGMLAAAVPGLLIGGGVAIVPRIALDCGSGGSATTGATTGANHDGVFDGPARISIVTGCGALDVSTTPGNAWHFDEGGASGRPATVDATSQSLSIDSGRSEGLLFHGLGRDDWHVTLPTVPIDTLSFVVNAGQGRIDLPGAEVAHLVVTTNAAEATVDLSAAAVASFSAKVNAGKLTVELAPGSDIAGSMDVNAALLQVCAPSELGVRVHHTGALSGITVDGRQQPGTDWESANFQSAPYHADLTVHVNLGSIAINPIGGCK